MTQQAQAALSRIRANVARISERFEDPAVQEPFEPSLDSEINDTIAQLLNIREEAREIDRQVRAY